MIWTNPQDETLAVPNIRHLSNVVTSGSQFRFTVVSDSDQDNAAMSGLDSFFTTKKEAEYQLAELIKILEEYHGFAGTFEINDYTLIIPFIKQVSRIIKSNDISEFMIYFIGRTSLHIKGDHESIKRRREQLLNCIDNFWSQKMKSRKGLRLV